MESISPQKELFQALQKVQAEMPSLKKSKEGFNYKYTPLEEMLSVVQPVLHKNGLMLIQPQEVSEHGQTTILTCLIHVETGQQLPSRLPIYLPENMGNKPMFAWGGALTYARRYAIKMILGIEPDMDTNTEDPDELIKHQMKKAVQGKQTNPAKRAAPKPTNASVAVLAAQAIRQAKPTEELFSHKKNVMTRHAEGRLTNDDKKGLVDLINQCELKLKTKK